MSIPEIREKSKALFRAVLARVLQMPRDVLVVSVLVVACVLSFSLGFLAGRDAGQGSVVSRMVETAP